MVWSVEATSSYFPTSIPMQFVIRGTSNTFRVMEISNKLPSLPCLVNSGCVKITPLILPGLSEGGLSDTRFGKKPPIRPTPICLNLHPGK